MPDPLDVVKEIRKSSPRRKTQSTSEEATPSVAIEGIRKNPYRVLGLTNTATQIEIQEAASSLRRTSKIGIEKKTEMDFPWLGTLERQERDIQSALAALMNPMDRLKSRLFWFQGSSETLNISLEELKAQFETLRETVLAPHDQALLDLGHALVTDPAVQNKNLWIKAIQAWQIVFLNEDFWEKLLEIEFDGEFEPACTVEEIEGLKDDAFEMVLTHLITLSKNAVLNQDQVICQNALEIIRTSGFPGHIYYQIENDIFGSREDAFIKLCEDIRSTANNKLNRNDSKDPATIQACSEALQRFDNEVEPELTKLRAFASEKSGLSLRLREEAAACLRNIALYYIYVE